MKIQTLTLLAAVATPLILTGSASAGFVGVKTTSKPNPYGLLVVNVYATFDRPDPGDGPTFLNAVAGTRFAPMAIEVIGGTFYNHPIGGDRAPNAALFPTFPSLAYDTFVTIGVKAVGEGYQPQDQLVILGFFPTGITGSCLCTSHSGWAVIPTAPQANPFNAPFSFPGDGQLLIGQFSTADGSAIQGTMLLSYTISGNDIDAVHTFYHVPAPGGLAMLGVAGLIGTRRRRRRGRRP